jgi:anti-anti-sigma regulatory factor
MQIIASAIEGHIPVAVFQVTGEITTTSYEQLQQQAQEAFEAGVQNVILDLTDVTFVSSAGLRAIHYIFTLLRTTSPEESDEAIHRGVREGTFKSPHLKLVNPSRQVLETLKTAGFDMFLEIHADRQTAIASF